MFKKLLFCILLFSLFSCKKNQLVCEITYTDNSKDTINVFTIDPEPYVSHGDLRTTHDSKAIVSGVRSFKVIKIIK